MEAPQFTLAAMLNLLGAVQAALLALVLVTTRRGNRTLNLLLAAFAANIAVLVFGSVLISTRYIQVFPHLSRLHHPFDYTLAPLLYLYVRELVSKKQGLKRKDLLHFIPFALCVIYLVPYYLQTGEAKLSNLTSIYYAQWYYLRAAPAILLALVYIVLIAFKLVSYSREVKSAGPPATVRPRLFQIRFLVITFGATWVLAAMRYVFDLYYPAYMGYTNLVLPLCATLIVYTMAYVSLRRPEAFISAGDRPEAQSVASVKKYEKSSLTPERAERYLKRLLEVMQTEKPYLDHELTVQKLAERLAIPAPHLSQTINERLNQNFSDLVNSYRVEEAKRLLLDPSKKHYSILAIAEEVGFNSKSAFNSVFKKHVNSTPSEWRRATNGHQSDS